MERLHRPHLTLDNYRTVLSGSRAATGVTYLVNTIVITIPAVLIPLSLATLAAYAFAWMGFTGRDLIFVAVFALQIVPIQVTLIPLLSLYVDPPFNLMPLAGRDAPGGGFYTLWLSHTIFALPLAIYLLHNFMSQIPGELIESARVDGAGHVQIFSRIMLPLMAPAIAAFAIFQFLWVWNDLLVALVFGGGSRDVSPLTVRLVEPGRRPAGQDWYLLAAGAFVSLVIPLVVFLRRQRFFVRGPAGRQRQGLSSAESGPLSRPSADGRGCPVGGARRASGRKPWASGSGRRDRRARCRRSWCSPPPTRSCRAASTRCRRARRRPPRGPCGWRRCGRAGSRSGPGRRRHVPRPAPAPVGVRRAVLGHHERQAGALVGLDEQLLETRSLDLPADVGDRLAHHERDRSGAGIGVHLRVLGERRVGQRGAERRVVVDADPVRRALHEGEVAVADQLWVGELGSDGQQALVVRPVHQRDRARPGCGSHRCRRSPAPPPASRARTAPG